MVNLTPESALKTYFGYNSFRAHQLDIISAILSGRDSLSVLPTGSGKSLCFQLPALMMDGTTIVISPLIALMQDQVHYLNGQGLKATFLNSTLSASEKTQITYGLNDYKLVYIAPERFANDEFMDQLKQAKIASFVIDEAHCISEWGHAFRPEYRGLNQLKTLFPDVPVSAFTATATNVVQTDIVKSLDLSDPQVLVGSFDRPNLTLRINERSQAKDQVLAFIERFKNESGIIYAGTRKSVEDINAFLIKNGYNSAPYHAGLPDIQRAQTHTQFMTDEVPIIVATVAFGMGVHKPDIRFVCHMNMPHNIEQYYQEIGRAGRDGLPAECMMIYSAQDLVLHKRFLEEQTDDTVKASLRKKIEQLFALCSSVNCRRVEILRYFNETTSKTTCNNCDNCLDEVEQIDGTLSAQKILSCVYRLQNRFGINYVIDVLVGSQNQNILTRRHDELSTYNIMEGTPKMEVRHYIFSLINLGALQISEGDYPLLQLTNAAKDILHNGQTVKFRKKTFKDKKQKAKEILGFDYDQDLYQTLKEWRTTQAKKNGVPPYVIFHDKTLMALAHYKPATNDALLDISGFGPKKVDKYGAEILGVVQAKP